MREGVVDHQVVDIAVLDAGHAEGLRPRDAEGARAGEVLHLADHGGLDGFTAAQDVDRLLRKILRTVGGGEDQRAAAIRHQAALQQAERVGDHLAVQHVVDRDRVLEGRARILARPFALHHGNHRHLLVRDAVGLHVAQHGDGKERGRTHRAEGRFELAIQRLRLGRARRAVDARLAALAMRDEDGLRIARMDGGRGMADMQHEGTAADTGAVHPFRRDAEVVRDLLRHHRAHAGHAVDVGGLQPRIRHRVQRGIRVQHDLRHVGHGADARRFRRADDGDLAWLDGHRFNPSPDGTGGA